MSNHKYTIEGLDCANCAIKVETAIKNLKEIEDATLNFATKTLSVKSSLSNEKLLSILKKTIDKVEDGVMLKEDKHSSKDTEHHSHEEHCNCEHNHNHNHEEHCNCEHNHSYNQEEKNINANHKYTIEGLDCANCAMKVETAIKNLKEIEDATLNFATKTLSIKSNLSNEKLLQILKKTIDKVEDGITLTEHNKNIKSKKKFISKDKIILAEIIISIIFLVVGLVLKFINVPEWLSMLFMGISAIIAGYRILIKGFKSIIKLNFNENVLMSIAVVAALCIGEFFEAAAVTVLASIGELFENKAVGTSRNSIEKLSQIRPDTAHIITLDGTKTVDAEEVKTGTNILVNPYERIPLDGIIYEGSSSIDTSALTGESIPRNVTNGDNVMSGMMNLNGVLKIRTTKTCDESAAARILQMVEESAAKKGKAENFITRFAKVYTPIILVCAILLCVIPSIFNPNLFLDWLNRALVFLVASCPCALVISVPLGFYSGIGACSKIGVLIKGGKYIEALSKADSIAFDKTGTLTSGELSVTKITAKNNCSEDEVLKIAAAAEEHSTHPAAMAIKKRAKSAELPKLTNNREKAGYGVSALLGDKKILCGNKRLFKDENLEDGVIYVSVNDKIVGEIYIEDTIRNDTPNIIKELLNLNFKHIVMLTGDGEKNAKKVAKSCGLNEYKSSLLPQDKTVEVEKLQKDSRVIFVGDGINDAPVLAQADCGFAMGLGSETAIETADAVLVGGTLAQLPTAIKLSRKTMKTVHFNIIFALAVKAIILVLAVLGIAPMWLAVLADTGVSVITVLNSSKILKTKMQK